jgi:hypothetical protein
MGARAGVERAVCPLEDLLHSIEERTGTSRACFDTCRSTDNSPLMLQ